MANNENLIPIPGRLHSVATEGHVAGANEIYDDTQQKDQETINSKLIAAVGTGGSVDSRITAAVNVEKTRAEGAESTLSTNLGNEVTRATNAENALDGRIDTLEEAVGTGGSVDSRISAAVATETTRAQGAESTLQTNIDSEATRAQAAESALNSGKADKATTLAGYGITDAYTKSETYTKTEVNGLVDTPHQEYVTVDVYANLPATGSKDTIYRVSNYNGSTSQVDASVYSEYAWNGTQYIFLCVKSQIGEVFDISVYNNNAKYANLAEALNGGANIPQSLQKGGMSVKFVQSSDNKYVQYRLMSQNWSTVVANWSVCENTILAEDSEFTAVWLGSDNKVFFGVQKNGNFFFGAGVPKQVIKYVEEKLQEHSFDKVGDIVSFIGNLLDSDRTLLELLNEKVDKESGKSLIDQEVADSFYYTEDLEFVSAITDKNGVVFEGIKSDASKEIRVPVRLKESLRSEKNVQAQEIGTDFTKFITEDNSEYRAATTDKKKAVIIGLLEDGRFVFWNDIKVRGLINGVDIVEVASNALENKEISDSMSYKNEDGEDILKINPNSVFVEHLLLRGMSGKTYELFIDDMGGYPSTKIVEI